MKTKQAQPENTAANPAVMVAVMESMAQMPQGCAPVRMALFDAEGNPASVGGGADAYELAPAAPGVLGGVKQAAHVADAAGDAVTAAEFNALLDALEAAGIVASS